MKVLLVPNNPGWAFDNRAKDLMALKLNNIHFSLKYLSRVVLEDKDKYDIIYPMSLAIAQRLIRKGIPQCKISTGITSIRILKKHIFNKKINKDYLVYLKKFLGINTWSDEIVNMFNPSVRVYKTRVGIFDGVFMPDRERKHNQVFTVGWVGRIDTPTYRKHKGFDIVLSALEGLDVKLDIRTYKENYVPRNKMVEFYQGLDCFICSSISEGLPNPVLEAASCGVPIISTKVGIVPELIVTGYNGIIVPRTSSMIRDAVKYLQQNPVKRNTMGVNARQTIMKHWTWDKCKKDWEFFFETIYASR